jgi:hypothetical protein
MTLVLEERNYFASRSFQRFYSQTNSSGQQPSFSESASKSENSSGFFPPSNPASFSSPLHSRNVHARSITLLYAASPSSKLQLDVGAEEGQTAFHSYHDTEYYGHVNDLQHLESLQIHDSSTVSLTSKNALADDSTQKIEYAEDDTVARVQPFRHVDYLSHSWKEDDLWTSWRHIVSRRSLYDTSARLENASWRTWMKVKNKLKTVPPESLNW